MAEQINVEHGQEWRLVCPFYWDDYQTIWRPGRAYDHNEDPVEGKPGQEIRRVVAVVPIAGHQTRVFYQRRWQHPISGEFGKKALRCTTLPQFRRWVKRGTQWNKGVAALQVGAPPVTP